MKNYYFILLLLLFGVSCKTSKEITVKFNSSKSDGFLGRTLSFIPPVNAADAQFALLAQKLNVDTFLIFGEQHSPEQYYYNEFKSENIDSAFFKKAKDVFDIDTSRLSHEKFDAETIFFMGKAKNGDGLIIADQNNNNILADDSVFRFINWFNSDSLVPLNHLPRINVHNIESSYNGDKFITSKDFNFRPLKHDTLIDGVRKNLHFRLQIVHNDYKEAYFKFRGKKYKLGLRNLNGKIIHDKNNTYFAIARKNKSYDFTLNHDVSNLYKTGETIFLNGMTARVSDLAFDGSSVKMHIQKSGADKYFAGNPVLTDFAVGDSFLLNNLFINKDLLVIDFWGSWCVPCISSIPDFKKLYETYSANRIGFLGILYDDLQNNKEIESLIDKNEIKWRQAFINRMDSNTLIDEWRIFAFPTYLVINKHHKIVFRGIGSTGFLKLKEFLEVSIRE